MSAENPETENLATQNPEAESPDSEALGTEPVDVESPDGESGEVVTDLLKGTLSREDRALFLKVWSLPDSTPDEDILMAIGAGIF